MGSGCLGGHLLEGLLQPPVPDGWSVDPLLLASLSQNLSRNLEGLCRPFVGPELTYDSLETFSFRFRQLSLLSPGT